MKKLLVCSAITALLSSCQTDTEIARINAYVQKYCAQLETASGLAAAMANKPLVDKINEGVTAYCNQPVTDVSSALLALAKISKAVTNAGIPMAAN